MVKKAKRGGIFLNGTAVTVRANVSVGDKIEIYLNEEKSEGIPPLDIPLKILYEDDDILAVDKPTNMPTHPSRGNSLPTLANAVMGYYGGDFVFRSVNRLDRDTSGIVIIAKNQISASKLSSSMKAGLWTKKYHAIIDGNPALDEGRIDAPIERIAEGNIKREVRPDGKRAITDYRVIERNDGYSLCELRLLTGRTHQIRVHLGTMREGADASFKGFGIALHYQIPAVRHGIFFAEGNHFFEFPLRIDVHQWEGDLARSKGFFSQSDHHARILTNAI